MRFTFNMQGDSYFSSVSSTLNEMSTASDKVTSKRNLLTPEQNASSYVAAYNSQRMIDELTQFSLNADNAYNWLTNADTELNEALQLVTSARNDYAIGGASSDQDAASRLALAGDVAGIYQSLFDIANASYNGRYLFGGFETETEPFVSNEAGVDNVISVTQNGGDIGLKHVFEDFPELETGAYSARITVNNGIAQMQITDASGNPVLIDSNSSDESGTSGNRTATTMTFEYVPNGVIDTGRGVTIKLPSDENPTSVVLQFDYKAGSEMAYTGDDGTIYSQIGYNQEVGINIPGSEIFSQTFKTIQGTKFNTTFGLPVTESTFFSQLDNSNATKGDSIDVSGTDYNGTPVGSATITTPVDADLDLSTASEKERTLTIAYGDALYKIVVPQASYENSEDLADAINQELQYAEYMGALGDIPADLDKSLYGQFVANQIAAGAGTPPNENPVAMQVDLSGQINVSNDGGRLDFTTTATGDNVRFAVTGDTQNALGFDALTIGAYGKDTTFELGKEYATDIVQSIDVTHDNIDFTNASNLVIDGVLIRMPTATIDAVTGEQTPPARELELQINEALRDAGLGFGVSAKIVSTGVDGEYDLTLTRVNGNIDADTELSTAHITAAGVRDLQKSDTVWVNSVMPSDKTVGDFLEFVEDLYGESVNAYIEDGKISIQDLRSGTSKTTINISPQNEGIIYQNFDVNTNLTVSGNYTGGINDEWTIETDYDAGTGRLDIRVFNSDNKEIYAAAEEPYFGGDVRLPEGIIINPDVVSAPNASVRVELISKSSLNFGNMNVVEDGSNINIFRSLQNLEHALTYNIANSGYSEPTAWENTELKSTASPYLAGGYTGAYNDNWHYEIQSDGSNEFYLQNEYTSSTGRVNFDAAMLGEIEFSVEYYDNISGDLQQIDINLDLAAVVPPIASAEQAQAYIMEELNNNPQLLARDLSFTNKDGAIQINSGSGTAIANFSIGGTGEVRDRTQFILGADIIDNEELEFPILDVPALDPTTFTINGVNVQVAVPAGGFADDTALTTAVNTALAGAGLATVQASMIDGAISFTDNGREVEASYNQAVVPNNNWLGLSIVTGSNVYSAGVQAPTTDLSEATQAQRTITFKYNDALGEQDLNIILSNRQYEDIDDMIDEINTQLEDVFAPAVQELRAVASENGAITFVNDSGTIDGLVVEGDYEGTLGFPAAGDDVIVKVTSADGNSIQELKLDTANKTSDIADGVKLGFNAGSLFATDSFSTAVGSGIDREISVLDAAEKQILLATTTVGNRGSRAESVMAFQETLIVNEEQNKAGYLGSSEADQAQAVTDWNLSITAYESALSVTGRIMSISLLDFLT